MSSRVLPIAIGALVLGAVAAATYVVFAASTNFVVRETGLSRFAKGELEKLIVLDEAPAQPQTVFVDEAGGEHRLADRQGKVTLVNIWATWCGPCVHELPSLDRLEGVRGSDRFEVIAISVDRDIAEARTWYDQNGIAHLPLYQENTLGLATQLGSRGVPITVLYSADGRELARLANGAEWDSPDALELIDAVLAAEFAGQGETS
ncbi:MAG: TlpA disulfide reductase family protein [Maricaulaceae bacterium]|jgi:thiol-disulfide isomerase/thioredoxin